MEDLSRFSMKHDGDCFRKSKYSSAAAEEHEASKAAEQLLLDSKGNARGADTCVFVNTVVADNDTRAPAKFIKRQNEILGPAVNNKAEHVPDLGHSVKCNNNEFFHCKRRIPPFKESMLCQMLESRASSLILRQP